MAGFGYNIIGVAKAIAADNSAKKLPPSALDGKQPNWLLIAGGFLLLMMLSKGR